MSPEVLQSVWAVLGAVVLGALAWWGWRRRPAGGAAEGGLVVRGSVGLGPGARVSLLVVGDRELLVGAAPGRITLLAAWPASCEAESGEGAAPPAGAAWDETIGPLGSLGVRRGGPVNRFGLQRYGQP